MKTKPTKIEEQQNTPAAAAAPAEMKAEFLQVLKRQLHVSPTNPRKDFPEASLAEMAESEEKHGIIQPLIVRRWAEKDRADEAAYEIVCGERRFRASERVPSLTWIPVIVRVMSDTDVLEIQRYLSLSAALRLDLETGQELSSEDEHARRQALDVLIEYVCQSGVADMGGAFKNFLAMVRRIRPLALEGITQTDLALILDEKKATTSAREKVRVEKVAKAMGVKGFHFLGGTKPEATRQRSAAAAKGNTNRRDGARRKRL